MWANPKIGKDKELGKEYDGDGEGRGEGEGEGGGSELRTRE